MTSLALSALVGKRDRKHMLLSLTLLMIISGTIVSFAPNYEVLMAGRVLIGIAIVGFWSLSAAVVMRLVDAHYVSRAFSILSMAAMP